LGGGFQEQGVAGEEAGDDGVDEAHVRVVLWMDVRGCQDV
jgi:hypothetical protein